MARSSAIVWLGRQARRGVTDLPRNVLWAFDVAVKDTVKDKVKEPARSAGHAVRSAGQQAASTLTDVKDAVADANPFTDGSGSPLDRVDAAMERAQELEAVAHDQAQDAKEQADAVETAELDGERRLAEARDDGDREVARVVDEAQREADAYVAAKRSRAEEIAARKVEAVEADVREHVDRAREQAARARAGAEQAVDRARQQMTQARELAEEAAETARKAADDARARAERLAGDAEAEARAARRRVDEAEERREAVTFEGRRLGADADTDPLDLDGLTKAELLALGTEMGLELTSSMRKPAILSAVRKHAGTKA